MDFAVLKGAGYVLAHAPDLVLSGGTTQTTERIVNPDSEYLKKINGHIRTFEQAVCYPPNQVYIGNMTPGELGALEAPWHDKKVPVAERFGKFGEIMPQDELYAVMELVDTFDLVKLTEDFSKSVKDKLEKHPLFSNDAAKIKAGEPLESIKALVEEQDAMPLHMDGELIGCVKRAHDIDPNLNSHVLFENLAAKATAVLAFRNLAAKNNIDPACVEYVIECSEEACGDMNQRGGGNFAKSIAEMSGAVNATGSDTRGFCAAPVHALIQAASLVKAGTYKNVAVIAGGAVAKLGMNGKDHVKKELPVLEDVLGGFAVLISKNDGESPILNTDLVGRHTVGTGSSPQAVITSLVAMPLEKGRLKFTDIDKYSVEMQNPDITKPAGAGDVPEANYKMIAALAVMRKEIERAGINDFIGKHGMPGWAPTQGHIPSGVPYLGFALDDLTKGCLNRSMIVGKGSLFLGRMTNLFDGVSIILERNKGFEKPAEAARAAVSVSAGKRARIGLTQLGSEHGVKNLVEGARIAARDANYDIVLIGPETVDGFECVKAADEAEMYKKMEELLDSGNIDGCVTMHYSFPLGVSTVGKVVTPATGREMLIATTTGTASANRVEAMVRNAVAGIIAAKAIGINEPTLGILNLDGAKQTEKILVELKNKGYEGIKFSESVRADGGAVMRGNDALCGSADVMVTDTLTGNILMKMFSSFTTGGSYESAGYGYGPGIGENYNRLILILSRASGAAVVANSLSYAAKLVSGNWQSVAENEFAAAARAGLDGLLQGLHKDKEAAAETVEAPPKEVVTEEIPGVDIMCLEDAVQALWKEGIYAESGMGCTGPVVLVNESRAETAKELLVKSGFLLE